MFLVVNGDGRYWDGLGWNVKGKIFCSVGSATRSLYEEGEGIEGAKILPLEPQQNTPQVKP
jgi:hypothetical protein